MDFLAHLWLPILASTLAVWIVSAVGWMFIGHHGGDNIQLPNEDQSLSTLRSLGLKPGVYMFPRANSHADARSEEMKRKWKEGPTGVLRVFGPVNMGVCMVQSVVVYAVISVLLAYLGWNALPHSVGGGARFAQVFQIVGTAGVLAYAFGGIPGDIWFQESRRAMLMKFIDALVYGLMTGAIFAALWPKA